MKKEEYQERIDNLKLEITVPEILNKYGVEIKRGRCKGICHDGKDLNAKVTDRYMHCYVCDKSMDIFAITQHFEYCDFNTAFDLLGGNKEISFTSLIKARQAKAKREDAKRVQANKKAKLQQLHMEITAYRNIVQESEPLSDLWTYAYNRLQYRIYLLEEMG